VKQRRLKQLVSPAQLETIALFGDAFSDIARWSIWGALEGDPALLARRLRSRKPSPQELDCAADLIEMKIKPRRPKKGKPTRFTNELIAETILYIECVRPHWLRKTILSEVAEAFGVSTKHVYNVLAEHRPTEWPNSNKITERILARK
jgi:hypothetical protein